jgi:prepilin-type processing-associated H-X9-DG protein
MVYPYVKSKQVFVCPSSFSDDVTRGNYGVNLTVFLYPPSTLKMSAVVAPASTYFITEAGNFLLYSSQAVSTTAAQYYLPGACTYNGTPTTAGYPSDCWSARHLEGNNTVFGDGHVKWLKAQVMVNEYKKSGHGAWDPNNS